MDTSPAEYGKWLSARAADAGFDPKVRGSLSALADAAGTDPGQTSRALTGKTIPSIETQRALAAPLGLSLTEMLVRSGMLKPDDLPVGTIVINETTADLSAIADELGVPAAQRTLFQRLVESVAEQLATSGDDDA
jgi:transcriptional regulator with XRE-family HTH domain